MVKSAVDQILDESSLDRLLKGLDSQIRHILFRYRIPQEDSEDLVQQTLLTLIYKRNEIEKPEPWILATLKNRCIMYWRRRRGQLHEAVDTAILELVAQPGPPRQEDQLFSHDLERAISRLPERCRRILRLRYGLDYKPSEVAEHLGYQASSIRKITNRCLDALTKQLVVAGFPGAKKLLS